MSAFIDPAESFSKALGQGLGMFKSYRDEARLDEETAFNRRIALNAEDRARSAEQRAVQTQNMLTEQNRYDISRRPFKEKVDQTQLEGFELNNKGQALENEWYPRIQEENLRSSRDASARGWAGIRNEQARISLARSEAAAVQAERDDRNAFRMLVGAIKTQDYNAIANNPKAGTAVLRMAGAAAGAPALLAAMQNPTGSWINDPRQKRAVLNVAAVDLGKTADNLGFRRGSVSIADLRPSNVKGKVNIDFVGINPRTGRLERRSGNMDANRLFDKAAVFANTMHKITNDPQARASMVNAFRAAVPDEYAEMLSFEISRREQAIKGLKEGTIKVADTTGYMTELQREVMLLQNNDSNAVGSVIFPRMQKVGREYVQSPTTRAYDGIEGRMTKGRGNPDAVITGINTVLDRAARDRKYYDSILKGAGISSAGAFDPSKVLRALGN
jgi:hypothetical protein